MAVSGLDTPGTYEISDGDKKHTVEADSLDYNGPDGQLQAWKDGQIVATFRWWTSVIKTK